MQIIMYAIPACTALLAAWYAILVLIGMRREECDICPMHKASVSAIAWFIVFMAAVYVSAQFMWCYRDAGSLIGWMDYLWSFVETSYLGIVAWYTRKVLILYCRDIDCHGHDRRDGGAQ